MDRQTDQFYSIEHIQGAVPIAAALLQSYPLTRACMEILGKDLLSKLEFGYFTEGYDIIGQGEEGKDIFMICTGEVDVLVNGQVVVQMTSPRLLGDKAIVDPNSKRAATIRVRSSNHVFVMKIPMGLFIRNFNDESVKDAEFKQEMEIYCNVFQGIQQRLFEYIHMQKKLGEEVNTSLNMMNSQAVGKILDMKKDLQWDEKVWAAVKRAIATETKVGWPDNIPLNINTFREIMLRVLDSKFPRDTFKGANADYISKRSQIWRTWLTMISSQVIKVLPPNKLPVQAGEMELFNPRNYHMRMTSFLSNIEKKFPLKPPPEESIFVTSVQKVEAPSLASFFGKGDKENEFQLRRYLASFENIFQVPKIRRTQAQIAQKAAQISAECENQFNNSVANMQKFLEKAKGYTLGQVLGPEKAEIAAAQLNKFIAVLGKAYTSYDRMNASPQKNVGQVQYLRNFSPLVDHLIRSVAAKNTRAEIDQVFGKIIDLYNIRSDGLLPQTFTRTNLFIQFASPGEIVPYGEIVKHYWMPISEGIAIHRGETHLGELHPGKIIGGQGWDQKIEKSEERSSFYLKVPERRPDDPVDKNFLFLLIPSTEMPWEKEKEVAADKFSDKYVPIMQWLINKHIDSLQYWREFRDTSFQKWFEIDQVIRLENKIKNFENTKRPIQSTTIKQIGFQLKSTINLALNPAEPMTSELLSKRIYNHILKQMGTEFPQMPVEERSNKSYTKWRFLLSELVQAVDRIEKVRDPQAPDLNPKPTYEIITNEFSSILDTYIGDKGTEFIQLTGENPQVDLVGLFQSKMDVSIKSKIMLFKLMAIIFETHLCRMIQEGTDFDARLKALWNQRPKANLQEMKLEIIQENVERLMHLFGFTQN